MNGYTPTDYLRARLAELDEALKTPLPSHIAFHMREEAERIRIRLKERRP